MRRRLSPLPRPPLLRVPPPSPGPPIRARAATHAAPPPRAPLPHTPPQIMTQMGAMWKAASAAEKKPYETEAAKLKASFVKPAGAAKKAAKAPKAPGEKKPLSGYFKLCVSRAAAQRPRLPRAAAPPPTAARLPPPLPPPRSTAAKRAQVNKENPGAKVTEVAKLMGAMWAKLSDAEKLAWK